MAAEVAILVPALNRPHRVEPLLASIEAATNVEHTVIFGVSDQPTVDECERLKIQYVRDEGGEEGTWPKRINRLYRQVDAPYIFTGADDLDFRSGWFEAALAVMQTVDGVVAINDLFNPNGVHFLISRNYIETLGCVIGEPPGTVCCELYLHCYVDDDLRWTAKSRNRFAFAGDSVVEHLHPGRGMAPPDETYAIGGATMTQGHQVFQSRSHLWS